MEVEESSLKIEFEEKRAFFGVGRGAQVGNLHLEGNFGASVDVGRIVFFFGTHQAMGSDQPSIWKKAKYFMICGPMLCHKNACGLGVGLS